MTEHDDDLKLVYTGSSINANYVKSILEENGIGALVRNTLSESLKAGWVSGAQGDSSRVFVSEENLEKALKIVEDYKNTKETEGNS
ncbi:MAG: DUF2007 domain-containing protein [Bacteroidales bacterium]